MSAFQCARTFARDERGASMVELALSAPFLIFCAIGIVEIGTFMYDGIEVANSARAGVQYAEQASTSSAAGITILAAANRSAIAGAAIADARDITLTKPTASDVSVFYTCESAPTTEFATIPTCSGTNNHLNTYVKVVAAGAFTSFLSFPGIPRTLTITRTAIGEMSP